MWKRSEVKRLRQSGEEYINRGKKVVPPKKPKLRDCSKCRLIILLKSSHLAIIHLLYDCFNMKIFFHRFKCNDNFPEDLRATICKEYYGLADSSKQKLYLSNFIEETVCPRRQQLNSTKPRKTSRSYFLPCATGEKKRVCLDFFCHTFSVSTKFVQYNCNLMSPISKVHLGGDNRIGQVPHNISKPEDIAFVKSHIDSFPRVPSPHCKKESRCEYLGSDLKLSVMYRQYVDLCKKENRVCLGETMYRKIFADHDPPLSFYLPKKD